MNEQINVGVTAFIQNRAGQLLLRKKSRSFDSNLVGKWVTPGGRVKYNETLEAATQREVLEETGIGVNIGIVVWTGELITLSHHFVFICYEGFPHTEEIKHGDDLDEVRWFDMETVSEMVDQLTPMTRQIIEHVFGDEYH